MTPADLIGKRLWACRRAADMATFQFGTRKAVTDVYGRPGEVGEYALHVQCAWRIIRDDVVLVGSRDLYYPAHYAEGDEIPGGFDWDCHPNRRDSLLRGLFEDGAKEFEVRRVDAGSAGAYLIQLDDGVALEIFPDDSLREEHWRLFATDQVQAAIVVDGTECDAK